ncbi:hypothetical protein E0Z10_g2014 [Xylaria hypoxylon]|uniref:Uncharacterized protein n=1 Tax=Xylaria hypoxylon TaxID=37992 RepID=A0A4Z0Z391_9PEZI|nr:hypothetical protein E0Z10_g2014 [Xylaria hypoxylon]
MNFFGVPTEVRLQIYSELLVLPEPIVFGAGYGAPSPPLFRSNRGRLCPALLRVNKQVHSEASSLLYSNNRFRFPVIFTSMSFAINRAHIAPFLCQIGSQASLIRYICISIPAFPTFFTSPQDKATFREAHSNNLELIRDTCTSITTLELSVPPDHADDVFDDSPMAAETLDLLDTHLKAITSLKEIIVNFQIYSDENLSDHQMKKIRDRRWSVEVTKIPKKVWISIDDRVEFDNEEHCDAYDEEWQRRESQREQEREDKEWTEEYYCRRRNPY